MHAVRLVPHLVQAAELLEQRRRRTYARLEVAAQAGPVGRDPVPHRVHEVVELPLRQPLPEHAHQVRDEGNVGAREERVRPRHHLVAHRRAARARLQAGLVGAATCDATTRFGWNAGLGTKWYVRGVRGFVEARHHRTSRDEGAVPHVPLTFGILP